MKTREGVPENKAFGPAKPSNTLWHIITKQGKHIDSWGSTAFMAEANAGLNLGQVANINTL
jgi:hypothetical protein